MRLIRRSISRRGKMSRSLSGCPALGVLAFYSDFLTWSSSSRTILTCLSRRQWLPSLTFSGGARGRLSPFSLRILSVRRHAPFFNRSVLRQSESHDGARQSVAEPRRASSPIYTRTWRMKCKSRTSCRCSEWAKASCKTSLGCRKKIGKMLIISIIGCKWKMERTSVAILFKPSLMSFRLTARCKIKSIKHLRQTL